MEEGNNPSEVFAKPALPSKYGLRHVQKSELEEEFEQIKK